MPPVMHEPEGNKRLHWKSDRYEKQLAIDRNVDLRIGSNSNFNFQLTKKYFKILQSIHHLNTLEGHHPQAPPGMLLKTNKLASFIKPAAPTTNTLDKIRNNTENWLFQNIAILKDHYVDTLSKELRGLGQFEEGAFLTAIKWGKQRYKRKLTNNTLDSFNEWIHQEAQQHADLKTVEGENMVADRVETYAQALKKGLKSKGEPAQKQRRERRERSKKDEPPRAGSQDLLRKRNENFNCVKTINCNKMTKQSENASLLDLPLDLPIDVPVGDWPTGPTNENLVHIDFKQNQNKSDVILTERVEKFAERDPSGPEKTLLTNTASEPAVESEKEKVKEKVTEGEISLMNFDEETIKNSVTPIMIGRIRPKPNTLLATDSRILTSTPNASSVETGKQKIVLTKPDKKITENNEISIKSSETLRTDNQCTLQKKTILSNSDSLNSSPVVTKILTALPPWIPSDAKKSELKQLISLEEEEKIAEENLDQLLRVLSPSSVAMGMEAPIGKKTLHPENEHIAVLEAGEESSVDSDFSSSPILVNCEQGSSEPMRHQITQKKIVDWTVQIRKPIVFLGDSNLSRIPPFFHNSIQVDSYPGATFHHIREILEKTHEEYHMTQKVILSLGLNNCLSTQTTTTTCKQLQQLVRTCERKFPCAEIYIPVIHYSDLLPSITQQKLEKVNKVIMEKYSFLNDINKLIFKVNPRDPVHWTAETAQMIFSSWIEQLNYI
ncbi:uncharacterized protein LOC130908817 isoform X1 [Corythoichthys intestinalis]|uniref:uncharacterized protein LOC130908814 isoform X5 n=1 Tax=Corythoichthys intestinalis TaxID=161448 RepID=UPI0025A58037|nr:uncharacterized protein LOC130908814 isoform X5 [Corythoichthys intestinalis]XP_057680628.1 uncharacterized protein LOC130908814 isoform X6 [Corythoichthys intestinalis]XP_057680629.1 uncharacterized protein LOC130908814 isoform X7 [Corythoichthys intestinalis]XP_057680630.1 uncharacterized protein LOC130908814 isoform X8 [Corythoichthys intestinalis]XP_057680648.1 uncharacterized protein LOC130908817 isoform X1 [Corythoichthys intestinalis]